MPLHRAGKSLADTGANCVYKLSGHKVVGRELRADLEQSVLADPKLGKFAFWFDIHFGKVPAHCLGRSARLSRCHTQLHGVVTVLFGGSDGHNLTIVNFENRHGNVLTGRVENTGHAKLLSD